VDVDGVPYRFVMIYKPGPDEHDPQAAIAAELTELVEEGTHGLARTA